ncbi:MAG: hypothetical protein M3467_01770, partial [Actinomycetota bacterium]|nr:hypothetical protein [Actinomycetota bacterium]
MTDSRPTVEGMSEVRVRPLRRSEYDLLVEQGAFDPDERIQRALHPRHRGLPDRPRRGAAPDPV